MLLTFGRLVVVVVVGAASSLPPALRPAAAAEGEAEPGPMVILML
jgi:hypothetical protein